MPQNIISTLFGCLPSPKVHFSSMKRSRCSANTCIWHQWYLVFLLYIKKSQLILKFRVFNNVFPKLILRTVVPFFNHILSLSKFISVLRPVSRKSRKPFGSEKSFVKVRPACSVGLVFSHDVKGRKIKINSKFRALERHRFQDTKRIMSPAEFQDFRETRLWPASYSGTKTNCL